MITKQWLSPVALLSSGIDGSKLRETDALWSIGTTLDSRASRHFWLIGSLTHPQPTQHEAFERALSERPSIFLFAIFPGKINPHGCGSKPLGPTPTNTQLVSLSKRQLRGVWFNRCLMCFVTLKSFEIHMELCEFVPTELLVTRTHVDAMRVPPALRTTWRHLVWCGARTPSVADQLNRFFVSFLF